jgi:hypothetical protein
MVMVDIVEKHINSCISEIQAQGKKRFNLSSIESRVITKMGGKSRYVNSGGYSAFRAAIIKLQEDGLIKPIESSEYNGMIPPLKTRWSIVDDAALHSKIWPEGFILQVSDMLDMSGYVRNPAWQTDQEKEYIENIYGFLKNADKREWASCEERCLELFGEEKFLSTGEKKVLARLNLTFENLKMKKYGQMFSYWIRNRKESNSIIILENHSTFFSFKRCAEKDIPIFSVCPDILIFGDGKNIIKSLGFLDEIADSKKCEIKYFGDIDPEGWLIYKLLSEKYPELNISLFMPAYRYLLQNGKSRPMGDVLQTSNREVLEYVAREFIRSDNHDLTEYLIRLWDERKRIPQEFITFETLINLKKV